MRCWNLLYGFLAKDVGELGVAEDLSVCVCVTESKRCVRMQGSLRAARKGKGGTHLTLVALVLEAI